MWMHVASTRTGCYLDRMSSPLHVLTSEALALDQADRLRLAAELIESVEGPEDTGWAAVWASELDRRLAVAESAGNHGRSWDEVRADLLADLAAR